MRTVFHQQLDDLNAGIAALCDRSGAAISNATQALLKSDLQIADSVISSYGHIARHCESLEAKAFVILARQAPVAGDLRAVVSSLNDLADIERMGALATHVASISRLRHPQVAVPGQVAGFVTEMGRIAARICEDTKSVVYSRDPERAAQIATADEAMDDLHRHLFTEVLDHHWAHGTTAAVDVTLLSRYYERFADHAVDIANRVIYQTTGNRPQP